MKPFYRSDSLIQESRYMWASIALVTIVGGLAFRLWFIQIYRGEYYQKISERNRIRRIEIPASRGILYDRNGEILLGNRPFFDLVYVPQYVKDREATFKILSRLLHIPVDTFEKRIIASRGLPKFLPVNLKRNLSLHEVSTIESNKLFLPGIEVQVAPQRDYSGEIPSHLVGYLREVDQKTLESFNKENEANPYLPGDLAGKQGLEARWEKYLRGQRGYRLIQVDAYGRQSIDTNGESWEYQESPAIPGHDLELTLDKELQRAAKEAFSGKNGAVVVLNPQTGEILAALSEPGFDPALMQAGLAAEEWRALTTNPFKPFLDKTTGGEFPPGSVYKPVIALAALQEKVVSPESSYYCPGFFKLGSQTFACHDRKGHGMVNLHRAIIKSCDVYFYQVAIALGIDKITQYARAFGLGSRLGVNLNMERPGLVPTPAWKQLVHRLPWGGGDTPNIAIGQGYNLITPMQMASLYASIANGGKVWRPFYVHKVTNQVGETIVETKPELLKSVEIVSKENFDLMRHVLMDVVMSDEGTGKNSRVEGHTVAGKTGSVQVVSLKKNRNQDDVSMNWKEHAMFAAFSPADNAEIAVAVVSQNDPVGGGGRSAAPVAGKIIDAYWKLKEKRAQSPMAQQQTQTDPAHGKLQ